jgi:hypothetical protein
VRIGEVAERAGLTTKALRYYEQAGLLDQPQRTPSGGRSGWPREGFRRDCAAINRGESLFRGAMSSG